MRLSCPLVVNTSSIYCRITEWCRNGVSSPCRSIDHCDRTVGMGSWEKDMAPASTLVSSPGYTGESIKRSCATAGVRHGSFSGMARGGSAVRAASPSKSSCRGGSSSLETLNEVRDVTETADQRITDQHPPAFSCRSKTRMTSNVFS